MVRQNIPTVLRIGRDELTHPIPLHGINPDQPPLPTFLSLFDDENFTEEKVAERAAALGAWSEPVIQDLDNEYHFEGHAPWGIEDDRPSDSLWRVYLESLPRRYPNRDPLIISNPIPLDDLPTSLLTPAIRERLPQCSNLLFVLRNSLHEHWFADLNFQTTVLHILTPWPTGAIAVPDILSAHSGLEECLQVATGDSHCRISVAQNYNISTPPTEIDRSWQCVLRAITLWHETSNPNDFWPNPVTPIDSADWGISEFLDRLREILHYERNQNPEGHFLQPEVAEPIMDMPLAVTRVLLALTRHVRAIEFARWEIDNGAEAILFQAITNTVDGECDPATGAGLCPVEVTALRRYQKHIFLGRTQRVPKMADLSRSGPAERFRRQMDTHPPGGDFPNPHFFAISGH
ncbi:hypothetical protein L873DRAFT_906900 [Choiromyces venosus 120613-1]|uniref:Uncharacterized protein n=1 Tax=Choiromyces venosus 120613-1 TaxID=1336337 RepID=A0A3N4JMJ6_9PEZI|nr:hypothetical protein L873DRAFT_906900 [Choiromyces venosus 120613-1]